MDARLKLFFTINDVVQLISQSDDPYPRLLIDYSMLKDC